MNDLDRMTPAERLVREELHRELVPPPTPLGLQRAVDALATDPPAGDRNRGSWGAAGARGLRLALGAAAVVAVAVVALAVFQARNENRVAATPPPTLPAVVGPALPPAAANPTRLDQGAWIDASTAWTIDQARNLRISEDGGQTWSEPRPVVQPTDLGFDMLDTANGYVGWAGRDANTWVLRHYGTSDGGRTWEPPVEAGRLDVLGTDRASLYANLHFTDPEHGVFLATSLDEATAGNATPDRECTVFATDTGGRQWAALGDAPCMGVGGVAWSTPTLGVVGSQSPSTISVTQDGGRTWTTAPTPTDQGATVFTAMLVAQSTDGTLRILGRGVRDENTLLQPMVYESRDGGATWEPAYVPAGLPPVNPGWVSALDGEHWLAVSELDWQSGMELHESWDAGRTWTVASRAAILPGWMQWFDRLHGTLQGVPIECSGTSCGGDGTILLTNDGGQSWHEVPF